MGKKKVTNQKPRATADSAVRLAAITTEVEKIKNSLLGDAMGVNTVGAGYPYNQGVPGTAPVENTGTIFQNLRYYFISNMRQVLNQAYVELGIVQTLVDVPVDDAFRGGIDLTIPELDEKEIRKLKLSLKRDGDILAMKQALKWNRLFGGAGVIIVTDQDPATELDLEAIGEDTPLKFVAVDMWELFWDKQNVEGFEPALMDDDADSSDTDFFNYYGEQLHKSRVMKLKGLEAPSFIRPRLRGWGFSIVETLVRSLNQYLKSTGLIFEVLDEFKLDVYKIKNLVNTLMSPNGKQKIKERVQLTNYTKNFQNAIVMDSEDDYDHKQLSFAGLAEAGAEIRMQLASDMRFPLTKLFGISAAGFNSGEDDLEVYNAMVESQVRDKAEFDTVRIVEIKCQKLFGFIPEDIEIEFQPLRVMSSEQEETVKTSVFNRVLAASTAGKIDDLEFREACNKENLLPLQLNTANISIQDTDDDVAGEDDGGASVEDDKGANDSDTEESETESVDEEPKAENDAKDKKDAKAKEAKNRSETKPARDPKDAKDGKGAKTENARVRNGRKIVERGASKEVTPPPFRHPKVLNESKYTLLGFDGPKIVTVGVISGSTILTGKRRDNGLQTNPGGHMEEGETPEAAACREVLEETGITLSPQDLTLISSQKITSHRTGKDFVVFAYLANIEKERASAENDPDQEVSEWKWVTLDATTPELMPEARHAQHDHVLNKLFNRGI